MSASSSESVSDEVLVARAFLCRVAEPACVPMWDFVRREGPLVAAAAIRSGDVPDEVAAATAARRASADPEADLEAGARHGMRLVVPESPEWPHFALAALEAAVLRLLPSYRAGSAQRREGGDPVPPLGLWVKGPADLAAAAVRGAAIVGSRAATAYGEHVTAELSYGLAARGFDIVSGGAYGIDAAAHRAALSAEGQTILVSAGGLDRPYPPGNAALHERVAATGLLVSENPPGAAPHRHRFLTRNRLIASLATGTVVVEAASRSGALNTARHCLLLGRTLMAVPGPVTSPMSAGCHALLRGDTAERTVLVASVEHVLEAIGTAGEGIDMGSDDAATTPDLLRQRIDLLDARARRVFDGLPVRKPAREDELAQRVGLPAVEVIRALPALRLAGLVESTDEGFRLAAAFRKRSPPPRMRVAGPDTATAVNPGPGAPT
ncbi:MAG TPA: DNA-processing protein DprA [Jatrophihabitantaceae bacterium]|nr:DNA-processing protein DprA [Jatrophihabitantaceae bacterium]